MQNSKYLIIASIIGILGFFNSINAQEPDYGTLVTEAEAEDGTLSGVTLASSYSGYSGTGYVTGFDNDNDKVTVNVNIPEKGFYRIVIRYNAPSGSKIQNFSLNGGPASNIHFEETTAFALADAGKYILEPGTNSFSIIKNWGWSNVDKFLVYEASENTYNISPSLVDSEASQEAVKLYEFLKLQFGKRIISGQTDSFFEEVVSLTGKTPMLRTGDFQSYTEGYPYLWEGGHTFGKYDNGITDKLIDWYNSTEGKAIISFQWHWHSPTGGEAGTNTFYTDYTDFDIRQAVIPGTQEYNDIIRDIDDIAAELKKFQDEGIPILWRPLHEAGGGWFWWGAQGPEPCLALYNILFDRLKNHHQLHNLIWVWSTPEEEWYPGNDKVDIIGHDSYPGDYNYGTQKTAFDVLYRLTNGEKLIAMTENGPIPDPEASMDGDAPWLLFMSWSDLVAEQNSDDHIISVYENPKVLTLESENAISEDGWRSALYPENWKPGYKDAAGRFLHDFSYAGYHKSEVDIPNIQNNVLDITKPPYLADNTGAEDVTSIIQQALDDAGMAGGGVVYLPAGIYRVKPPPSSNYSLRMGYDNIILRGAGPDSTFILNDETYMRKKDIIRVAGDWAGWFQSYGMTTDIRANLLQPTRIIPVESASGFSAGDDIIIHNPATEEFIAEHKMTGYWTEAAIKGVAFKRKIDSVDIEKNLIFIDAPTRYYLKTRDNAKIYHARKHLNECGIEYLSIGNTENPKEGWDEESYTVSGTGAYDVHFSQAIRFSYAEDCWVRNVNSYKPEDNLEDIHILSNFLLLDGCRQITVDSCFFQKPQYEGGGGNGYMYTLQSNDCLIKNSRANHSRHNYDFKYPFSNGNVIHNCRGENSKYSSDFHMYLSMSNLFDVFTVNGDYLESAFRPWGGSAIHGYSSTQSVFYNTFGEAYHPNRDYLIESRQWEYGYIIGTSGPASSVKTEPVKGITNGYNYDTAPEDFVEGVGEGKDLHPVSLYLDQFERRINGESNPGLHNVRIEIRDELTGQVIPDAHVSIYGEIKTTDNNGIVTFQDTYNSFLLSISAEESNYKPLPERQIVIYSDTTLEFLLSRNEHDVTIRLYDDTTLEPFWGVNVSLNGMNKVTNNDGEVFFRVPNGEREYLIEKVSYRQESGILTITSDTIIDFFLVRTHANLKFRLRDETVPVNNAVVKVNEDSLLTNSLGIASFNQLLVNEIYEYRIYREDYEEVTGQLKLSTDTTVNVEMIEYSVNINEFRDREGFVFWPNPASESLQLQIPENSVNSEIRISGLKGEIFLIKKHLDKKEEVSLKNLVPGTYILQFLDHLNMRTFLFIKE